MSSLAQKVRRKQRGASGAGLRRKSADDAQVAAKRPAYMRAKMAVSAPRDSEEQEADRVADQVSRLSRAAAPGADQAEAAQRQAEEPVPAARRLRRTAGDTDQTRTARRQPESGEDAQTLSRLEEDPAAIRTAARRIVEEGPETAKASVRRAVEEEPDAIKTTRRRKADEAPEPATAQTDEDAHPRLSADLERRIEAMRGTGRALPPDVLADMEAKLGHGFTSVRIHTDGDAAALAKRIRARAFTVGSDIFFAEGEYAPTTEQGRKLLAHELTHVVQGRATLDRKTVRRSNGAGTGGPTGTGGTTGGGGGTPTGTYHSGEGWVEFANLPYPKVPEVKDTHFNSFLPLIRHHDFRDETRRTKQNANWFGGLEYEGSKKRLKEAPGYDSQGAGSHMTFKVPSPYHGLRTSGPQRETDVRYLMGSLDDIARQAARPTWTPQAKPAPPGRRRASYEIDHVVEVQAGAVSPRGDHFEMRTSVDSMENYILLRGEKNDAKGKAVTKSMGAALARFINGNPTVYGGKPFSAWKVRDLKKHLSLQFNAVSLQTGLVDIGKDDVWTREQIESGAHIQALLDHKPKQIQCVSLTELEDQVPENHIWLFHTESGGRKRKLDVRKPERNFLKPFELHPASTFQIENADETSTLATFYFSIPKNHKKFKPMEKSGPVLIKSLHGSRKLGFFEKGRTETLIGLGREAGRRDAKESQDGGVQHKNSSPIQVDSVDLQEPGLAVTGRIVPSMSIFEDATIDFALLGDELTFSKTFLIDEVKVPPPFKIKGSSITISDGTGGFGIQGDIDYGIDRLGEGTAKASYHRQRGIRVLGTFDFDDRIFGRGADAKIRFRYEKGEWGIGGTVTVPRGKVPGIRRATIDADYSESTGFTASGDAQLDIPGVESGTLRVTHTDEDGLSIGGRFNLSNDIPGIRGGSVEAELRERPDGKGFSVAATGEAEPEIPGFDSKLRVAYEDGAITMDAEARYARGMLDGTVRAGATNRALDTEGKPTGEPGRTLIFFGGGQLTIQIAPWLQGTAGVAFAPDGEVTVTGEIALPSTFEIFPRREINKSIFNIAVQAPIIPGIVAEVGGGLSAMAGIGPGVIDKARIGVEYNPAHEERTHVTGDAHLSVPADAGLRLAVRAGIGLGITGASATGGLEIGGALGIEGAAEAGVHLDWMPTTGLDIKAHVSIHAQPAFTFDLSGYVSVRALGFSVYDERWEFASFKFGSDYRFGICLPIHYHEGEPFDISLDDVEFDIPPVDTGQMLKGLIARIA